jgi:hypothetical protein
MGWTCGQREKGISTRDYLGRYYSPSKIVTSASHLGVTYMAVEKPDGYVFGLVVLTRSRKDGEFCHKEVSEDMGPCECDCPAKILDLLSEPPSNTYAKEWREKCRERVGIRKTLKKLKTGDEILFREPINFNNGAQHQRLKFDFHKRDLVYTRDCAEGRAFRLKLSYVINRALSINDGPLVPEA